MAHWIGVILVFVAFFSSCGRSHAASDFPVVRVYEHVLQKTGFSGDGRLKISVSKFEQSVIQKGAQITGYAGRNALQFSVRARSAATLAIITGLVMISDDKNIEMLNGLSKYNSSSAPSDLMPDPSQFTESCTSFSSAQLCRMQNGQFRIGITHEFQYPADFVGLHPPGFAYYYYTDTGLFEGDARAPIQHRFTEFERQELGSSRRSTYFAWYNDYSEIPSSLKLPSGSDITSSEFSSPEAAGQALAESGLVNASDTIPKSELTELLSVARDLIPEGALPLPRVVDPSVFDDLSIPSSDYLSQIPTESGSGGDGDVPVSDVGGPDYTDPNIPLPDAPDSGDLLSPFRALSDALNPLRNLNLDLQGLCTPIVLDIPFFEVPPSSDAHCQLVEQHRNLFYLIFTAVWSIVAFRIIMEA